MNQRRRDQEDDQQQRAEVRQVDLFDGKHPRAWLLTILRKHEPEPQPPPAAGVLTGTTLRWYPVSTVYTKSICPVYKVVVDGQVAQAARLPRHYRGQHELQPRLPDLLRRFRPTAGWLRDHRRAVPGDAGRVRGQRG